MDSSASYLFKKMILYNSLFNCIKSEYTYFKLYSVKIKQLEVLWLRSYFGLSVSATKFYLHTDGSEAVITLY